MRKSFRIGLSASLLPIFLAMVLWTCGGGGDGGNTQSELAGTWDTIEVDTGSDFGWERANVSIDGSGNITVNSLASSSGDYSGPPVAIPLKWVVDGSGTIREYDTGSSPHILSPTLYGSLASNGKLAVATDNGDEPWTHFLIVARKRDASITFADSDIRGKTFVYHHLYAGLDNSWRYGHGSIGASGNLSLDNAIGPSLVSDPGYPQTNVDTLSVSAAGNVTNADNTFYGMLTSDKSTVFGVLTHSLGPDPRDRLVVFTFLGQAYAQADLAGTWRWHSLYGWNSPGWLKGSWTIDAAGAATYDDTTYLTDTGWTVPPATPETLTLAPDGIITNSSTATYHGTMSAGKDLYVRTKSSGTSPVRHSMAISVK